MFSVKSLADEYGGIVYSLPNELIRTSEKETDEQVFQEVIKKKYHSRGHRFRRFEWEKNNQPKNANQITDQHQMTSNRAIAVSVDSIN